MLAKIAKHLFALAVVTILFSSLALAQQGAVRGKVVGISEGGSSAPVEGAVIEIYRLDISQKFQTKTDKKGEYFHSLPAFGEYAIGISGAGFTPLASSKFKVVSDAPIEQNFELAPGDGSKLTLEQVKNYTKQAAPAGSAPVDAKKAQEEQAKLAAERERIAKENEKIKAQFGDMKKHFETGIALNQKQDYEGAINEFKQAVAIDDSQPTIYANLALALYNLGAIRFNAKQKDDAKALFLQSADYGEKATKMNPTSAEFLKIYGDSCDILFRNFSVGECADKAIVAYSAGSEAETDPAKKLNMINKIGAIYFNMGDIEKSMATYEKVLATDPNDLQALSGKGLVLAASGEKPKMEQAIALFQQVVDKAPDGSRLKNEAETNIKYLADTLKIEVGPAKKDDKGRKDDKGKKKK
jgi:tetratricopeptide (TPR) repeat protein